MYYIHLEEITLQASIGCYDFEKLGTQNLLLDLKIKVDAPRIALSDNLSDTVDYDKLSQALQAIVSEKHFDLIETLAAKLVKYMDTKYPNQLSYLKLSKPQALSHAKNVAIIYHAH